MTKLLTILLRWGRFQPNFRRPLAVKQWMGPKMMARTTSITIQMVAGKTFKITGMNKQTKTKKQSNTSTYKVHLVFIM